MISSTQITYQNGFTQTCKFPRVGMVVAWAGDDPPAGALWCDGTDVEKNTYPNLLAKIGTRYNNLSTPNTHFKLPDFKNKFLFGASSFPITTDNIEYGSWRITDFKHQHTVIVNVLNSVIGSRSAMSVGGLNARDDFGGATGKLTIEPNTTASKVDLIPRYTTVNFIIYY